MTMRFVPLLLLFGFSSAHADGMPPAPPAAEEATAAVKPIKARASAHKRIRLPRGDLRHCLELQSNEEIIACAEKRKRAKK